MCGVPIFQKIHIDRCITRKANQLEHMFYQINMQTLPANWKMFLYLPAGNI